MTVCVLKKQSDCIYEGIVWSLKLFHLERLIHGDSPTRVLPTGPGKPCLGIFNFHPPLARGLALSDCFQDGGSLGPGRQLSLAIPLEPQWQAGRGRSSQHFPPEVSWCPASVYTEGGAVPPALSPLLSGEPVLSRPQAENGETTVSCRPRGHSVGRILGKSTPTSKSRQMVREGCDLGGRSLKGEEEDSFIQTPAHRKATGQMRTPEPQKDK